MGRIIRPGAVRVGVSAQRAREVLQRVAAAVLRGRVVVVDGVHAGLLIGGFGLGGGVGRRRWREAVVVELLDALGKFLRIAALAADVQEGEGGEG